MRAVRRVGWSVALVTWLSATMALGAPARQSVVLSVQGKGSIPLTKTLRRFLVARNVTIVPVAFDGEPSRSERAEAARKARAAAGLFARLADAQVTIQLFSGRDGALLLETRYEASDAKSLRVPPFNEVKRLHRALAAALKAGPASGAVEASDELDPPPPPPDPRLRGVVRRTTEDEAQAEADDDDQRPMKPLVPPPAIVAEGDSSSPDERASDDAAAGETPAAPDEPRRAPVVVERPVAGPGGSVDEPLSADAPARTPARVERQVAPGEPREDSGSPPLVVVAFGPAGFHRDLSYEGREGGSLATYQLALGPKLILDAGVFPFARSSQPWMRRLGLIGAGEVAIGLTSVTAVGARYPTSYSAYRVGAHGGYPLSFGEVFARISFEGQQFTITSPSANVPKPPIPNVSYSGVRVGPGVSVAFSPAVRAELGVAYLAVLGAGELSSEAFFPRLSGGALDVAALAAFRALPSLEVRLGGELRRYAFRLNAQATDPFQATGAADLYAGFVVSGAYLFQ